MYGQDTLSQVVSDSVHIIDYIARPERIEVVEGSNPGNSLLGSIENQSFATIRSGGPSILSTILHRGMASRHLAVLWGGFNIQSVVNGTYDLGLIRNTFDQVQFYSNSTTTATGNASIAGALSLDNQIHRGNATSFGFSGSTAKNIEGTITNKLRHKSYSHHLALNLTSNKNEYAYKNGGVQLTQKSAKFSMWSLNYEGHYITSDHFSMTGGVWLQNASRNIPPTKTSVNILQEQKDVNYRGYLRASYYPSEAVKFIVRSAYFDELLDYQAPGISSIAKSKIFNGALHVIHQSGLSLSTQYRTDRVDATFFEPIHERETIAIFADYKNTLFKEIELGISIRPEWVDNQRQPLGIGLRLSKPLSNNLTSSLRYNKGYTLPSFNDLYWPTGGNPDLKTERSHEFELGFKYKYGQQKSKSLTLNLYLNLIDDWIQWTPMEGFFQPINQRKVRNLGFEFKVEESFEVGKSGEVKLGMMYSLTDSKLAKHYLNPENEGKRTIFVPLHKLNGQISWLNKSWQLHLNPLFYSKRYHTVDNSAHVPGYFILDIEAIKTFNIKKSEFQISLRMENGLNNDYENIKFYPMPLRVFRLGVNIKL